MEIVRSPHEIQDKLFQKRLETKCIGFVPTMGCLHKGHISLIQSSLESCDITVVSIFVNPTQFTPSEDFDTYPQSEKEDINCLISLGVDFLFMPSSDDMYPGSLDYSTQVTVPYLSYLYCYLYRDV